MSAGPGKGTDIKTWSERLHESNYTLPGNAMLLHPVTLAMEAHIADLEAELARRDAGVSEDQAAAWVNGDELDNMFTDRAATVVGTRDGWHGTPLYRRLAVVSEGQAIAWMFHDLILKDAPIFITADKDRAASLERDEDGIHGKTWKVTPLYDRPAAPAAEAPEVADIDSRTERIRLSHANADSKGKIQLRHEVECLLAHTAILKSERAAPVAEAPTGLATMTCPACHGYGFPGAIRSPDGRVSVVEGCDDCHGQGKIIVAATAIEPPEFCFDHDGELCMDWHVGNAQLSVSIGGTGRVSWAMLAGDVKAHGSRDFAAPATEQAKAKQFAHYEGLSRATKQACEEMFRPKRTAQASPVKPDLSRLTRYDGGIIDHEYGSVGLVPKPVGRAVLLADIEALLAAITKEADHDR